MISLSDVASLKNVAMALTVPIFTYATMVEPVFTKLPLIGPYIGIQGVLDPWAFISRCLVLAGLVGGLMFSVTWFILATARDLEKVWHIKLHWTDSRLKKFLQFVARVFAFIPMSIWVGWTCITAGLFGVQVVVPESLTSRVTLPPAPLHPLWHLGLLCYGIGLIELDVPHGEV